MKKIVITFAFFALSFTSIFSQNLAGKRIISGNLSLNLASLSNEPKNSTAGSTTNSNFALGATFLSGKVRENNTYTAYGFNVNITSSGSDGNRATKSQSYSLGPAIQFGKFIKVFDQFYFAPNSNFGVLGSFGSSTITGSPNSDSDLSGFGLRANISPLNFIYQVKDNLLLSMNLGSAGINYAYNRTSNQNSNNTISNLNVYGSVSNFSGIGAYYLF